MFLGKIKAISGYKTEIAYLTQAEEDEKSHIYVIKPFSRKLAKVVNPFYGNEHLEQCIFVNSDYLVLSC
jgi:hypothetical protein